VTILGITYNIIVDPFSTSVRHLTLSLTSNDKLWIQLISKLKQVRQPIDEPKLQIFIHYSQLEATVVQKSNYSELSL